MSNSITAGTGADVRSMDELDPLRDCRALFHIPAGMTYLDGNSLGPAPKAAFEQLHTAIHQEWSTDLITSWNKAGWFDMPKMLGDKLGNLIGAAPGQIVFSDTTSINIYKALHAALGLNKDRKVIVSELDSFPTDLYMLEGAGGGTVYETRLLGRDGDSLEDLVDDQVAVILLSQVNYRTGQLFDMKAITELAHRHGALIVWDLCHSAGVVPIDLDGDQADFAVGCSYKYLNAGPGAPAFVYAAQRHLKDARQPLSGWWGHARPFAFEPAFEAHTGIEKFLCGTQPILSMTGIKAGLGVMDDVSMDAVRRKSLALTRLFMDLTAPLCDAYGLELVTPQNDAERGSQVAFRFTHGYEVIQAMIDQNVVGDFRAPDLMRFGFAPLYLGFGDVQHAVDVMADCLKRAVWNDEKYSRRGAVT